MYLNIKEKGRLVSKSYTAERSSFILVVYGGGIWIQNLIDRMSTDIRNIGATPVVFITLFSHLQHREKFTNHKRQSPREFFSIRSLRIFILGSFVSFRIYGIYGRRWVCGTVFSWAHRGGCCGGRYSNDFDRMHRLAVRDVLSCAARTLPLHRRYQSKDTHSYYRAYFSGRNNCCFCAEFSPGDAGALCGHHSFVGTDFGEYSAHLSSEKISKPAEEFPCSIRAVVATAANSRIGATGHSGVPASAGAAAA